VSLEENHVDTPASGFMAEGLCDMRLADARRACENEVASLIDEAARREIAKQRGRQDGTIELEVEGLKGHARSEARGLQALLKRVRVAAADFVLHEQRSELEVAEF